MLALLTIDNGAVLAPLVHPDPPVTSELAKVPRMLELLSPEKSKVVLSPAIIWCPVVVVN